MAYSQEKWSPEGCYLRSIYEYVAYDDTFGIIPTIPWCSYKKLSYQEVRVT